MNTMMLPLFFACVLVTLDLANLLIVTTNIYIQGHTIDDPHHLINITTADKNLTDDVFFHTMKTMKMSFAHSIEPILRQDHLSDLPNLENFEVSFIKAIETGAFRNVPKLVEIKVVQSYFFEEIPEGVFSGLDVVKLVLRNNKISTIEPRAFDNMSKLEEIDLSRNELKQWNNDWFFNTPKLKHIDFSLNSIKFLADGAFRNLQNEEIAIFLRVCGIKSVGKRIFAEMKRVKSLDLTGNHLQDFGGDVLDGVEEIQKLELTFNNIRCFSGDFGKIFVAKYTDLSYNLVSCSCVRKIDEWKSRANSTAVISFFNNPRCA